MREAVSFTTGVLPNLISRNPLKGKTPISYVRGPTGDVREKRRLLRPVTLENQVILNLKKKKKEVTITLEGYSHLNVRAHKGHRTYEPILVGMGTPLPGQP